MKKILFITLTMLAIGSVQAQDTTQIKQTIDPSKPTNLYTQVNGQFEYRDTKDSSGSKLTGTRFNIQYAINKDNLLFIEVPLMNNPSTKKFGLSDVRVRYFNAVKRNITSRFIAIAPFADITMPTGSVSNGLGSGNWSLAAGVVGGFILTSKLAIFPGVSYVHITNVNSNGVGFQLNGSYSFNKSTFMFVNPTPAFLNNGGKWTSIWSGDVTLNKVVVPNKFKMYIGCEPNFTFNTYNYKLGATIFL